MFVAVSLPFSSLSLSHFLGAFAGCTDTGTDVRAVLRVGLHVNRFCPGSWFNLVEVFNYLVNRIKILNHELRGTEPSVWFCNSSSSKNQLSCSIFGSVTRKIQVMSADVASIQHTKARDHASTLHASVGKRGVLFFPLPFYTLKCFLCF